MHSVSSILCLVKLGLNSLLNFPDTLTIVQRLSWSLLVKRQDPETGVGVVVFQKPEDNELYDLREVLEPPYCEEDDKPDAAW